MGDEMLTFIHKRFTLVIVFPKGVLMGKTAFAVKLDEDLQEELKTFCDIKGLKQNAFVEKAVREQMRREELAEDLLDFYTLRTTEPHAASFDTYLKQRR